MFRYLLILAPIFFGIGCSSDDDSNLVGKWKLYQLKVNCPSSGESYNLEGNDGCYSIDGDEACFLIELKDDGTGTVTTSFDGENDVTSITYTQSGDQATLCFMANDCQTLQFSDGKLTYVDMEDDCTLNYAFTK